MKFVSADLRSFRNIARSRILFGPRYTALIGHNGQGKTNALEALYMVAGLRPLRNVPRSALLREGDESAEVHIQVEKERTGLHHDLGLKLTSNARVLTLDGKKCETDAFLGHAVAVSFTPDDLQLVKAGPEVRRRFMDRALLDLRPSYLPHALRYQRALKSRNKLLAEGGMDESLDVYDAILAQEGAFLVDARRRYTHEIAPLAKNYFDLIAQPAPALSVRYVSNVEVHSDGDGSSDTYKSEVEAFFSSSLKGRRASDRRRKKTSIGPHLDELALEIDGASVRERASQGQQRALVLALKIAEIVHLTERLGEPPILLLDDMSSELDRTRSRQLFETMGCLNAQVILTSTDDACLHLLPDGRPVVYRVSDGAITQAHEDPS